MAGFEGGVPHAAPPTPASARRGRGRCGHRTNARGVGMVVVAPWCDRDDAPWRRHGPGRGPLVGGRHGRGHACRALASGRRTAGDQRGLTTAQQVMDTMTGCARLPRTHLRAAIRSGRSPCSCIPAPASRGSTDRRPAGSATGSRGHLSPASDVARPQPTGLRHPCRDTPAPPCPMVVRGIRVRY
jgi:hypothetical protein